MAFVSYAQNAEDVMLYRALRGVVHGHYIDIGANHPLEDSVTKAFYDRGWSGINIEPVSQWFTLLQQQRPRDTNLQIAISDRNDTLDFFEVVETGLSTLDAERAAQCRREGLTVLENPVKAWTLEQLLDQYGQTETHFLKIDVEGAETQVIASGNWNKHRPWIVLVESTHPNTNISDHDAWEPTLLNHGYQFVWFDGINRFYLANEHQHLAPHFQFPINVLDRYVPYREVILTESRCQLILDMEARHDDFQTELSSAKAAIESAKQAHDNAAAALQTALQTAQSYNELLVWYHQDRFIRTAIRIRKIPAKIKQCIGRPVRWVGAQLVDGLGRFPRLKHRLAAWFSQYPRLVERLRWLTGRPLLAIAPPQLPVPTTPPAPTKR